jgi:hypothetical protein
LAVSKEENQMKHRLLVVLTLLSSIALGGLEAAVAKRSIGRPADKATGSVVVTNVDHPLRRHWFAFAAHETGDLLSGKGFLAHARLSPDGTEVLREEYSIIRYATVEGNQAWFTGPIVYDSTDDDPQRWMVVHVSDGGPPRSNDDWLWFARVAGEDPALEILENMTSPGITHDVRRGNLKVHSR